MIENYLNYGKCRICGKNKPRMFVVNICEDCFDKCLEELEKLNES